MITIPGHWYALNLIRIALIGAVIWRGMAVARYPWFLCYLVSCFAGSAVLIFTRGPVAAWLIPAMLVLHVGAAMEGIWSVHRPARRRESPKQPRESTSRNIFAWSVGVVIAALTVWVSRNTSYPKFPQWLWATNLAVNFGIIAALCGALALRFWWRSYRAPVGGIAHVWLQILWTVPTAWVLASGNWGWVEGDELIKGVQAVALLLWMEALRLRVKARPENIQSILQ